MIARTVVLLLTLFEGTADACMCGEWQTPAEAFENATHVFVGTVLKIEALSDRIDVVLRVQERGKNATSDTITIATRGTCAYPFEVGRQYLVYAREQLGLTTTNMCSRTGPIAWVFADLEELRRHAP